MSARRQILKDKQYRIIGYIDTDSTGRQTVKDEQFRIHGFYDPGTDVTKDAQHRRIGFGNLLTTLLPFRP